MARVLQSKESLIQFERLNRRLGVASVREVIVDDYLVLYAVRSTNVHLPSIKHHRQLSFDLKGHWGRR